MWMLFLCVVTPCDLIGSYRRFKGTYHLHLQSGVTALLNDEVLSYGVQTPIGLVLLTRRNSLFRIRTVFEDVLDFTTQKNNLFLC
jgi:hypothetical protein